jgi:hypothetical protein
MTKLQEIDYALSVAQGNIPAYTNAISRRFWILRALSLMDYRRKLLLGQLGPKFAEVHQTLEKLRDATEAWIDAEAASDAAKAKLDDLSSEAERAQKLLDK